MLRQNRKCGDRERGETNVERMLGRDRQERSQRSRQQIPENEKRRSSSDSELQSQVLRNYQLLGLSFEIIIIIEQRVKPTEWARGGSTVTWHGFPWNTCIKKI